MCDVQARLASGEDVFGPLIQRFLLDNNHKVTVELLPDSKLGAIVEADEKKRLEVRTLTMVGRNCLKISQPPSLLNKWHP